MDAKETLEMLDSIEDAYAPALSTALEEATIDLLRQYADRFTTPALSSAHVKLIVTSISRVWFETTAAEMRLMQDEFKDTIPQLDLKNDFEAQVVRAADSFANSYGARRAAQILRTTEKQVQDLIRGGMARGESAATVVQSALNNTPEFATLRGQIITRTEAHTVSQVVSTALARQSRLTLTKIWNSNIDSRTRRPPVSDFNHLIMDGHEVALENYFQVPTRLGGVERLLHPGHPSGSAGNVINCRCIQTFRRQE